MDIEQTRKEALRSVGPGHNNWAMRSCWRCNAAHEHLKQATYVIWCFACGHWYYKGVDITLEGKDAPTLEQAPSP